MKELTKEQQNFIQNARVDTDRMIIGSLCIILIFMLWIMVIGTGVENRLLDGLLGSTVTAFILIVQFFFRSSGHAK